jgi:hypothetical protein
VDVHVPKGWDQKLAGTVEYYGSCDLQVLAGANADDSFSDDNDSGVGLRDALVGLITET